MFGRRARALWSQGNGVARILSISLWESSALVCPFSRENWGNHLPPAARVQPLLELTDESAGGINISHSSAADECKLLEEDVLSLVSSDPAGSALLAHGGLMKAERIFLSLLSLSAPRM